MTVHHIDVIGRQNLQFQDDDHGVVRLEGIVQLDKPRMLERSHDLNFSLDILPVLPPLDSNEFGGQGETSLLLAAQIDSAKFTPENNWVFARLHKPLLASSSNYLTRFPRQKPVELFKTSGEHTSQLFFFFKIFRYFPE